MESTYRLITGSTRTILLVDHDGVVDVLHDDVVVGDIVHLQLNVRSPRLDPQSIVRAGELAVLNREPADIVLIRVLPEAPNADPVSRAAPDSENLNVLAPRSHGDAVVPSGDDGVNDPDVL